MLFRSVISGITEDIDGDIRDASYPDIGADEYGGRILDLGKDMIACHGDSVTLNAGEGFDSYQWSTGGSTQTIKLGYGDLEEQTEYFKVTVMYRDYEFIDSVGVTYYNPIADAGNDTAACYMTSIALDAHTDLNCEWYHETEGLITQNAQMTYMFDDSQYQGETYSEVDFALRVFEGGCENFDTVTVKVHAKPDRPQINEENGVLVCSVEGDDYEWYLNGEPVDIDTKSINSPEEGGYQVRVYNGPCFSEWSDTYSFLQDVGIYDLSGKRSIWMYPNPAKDKVFIRLEGIHAKAVVKVFNIHGQLSRTYAIPASIKGTTEAMDVTGLSKGVYLIQIEYGEGQVTGRLILE